MFRNAAIDRIQMETEYQTSAFVHSWLTVIFNDLTNRIVVGDEDDITLLKRLAESPKTLHDIASFPDIKRLDEKLKFPAGESARACFTGRHAFVRTTSSRH